MHMIKQTFKNFYAEHRVLSFVLIGMIAFPVAIAILGGLISLALFILSLLFGKFWGTIIFVLMLVGAIAGYIAGTAKPKEHGDYY